MKTASFLVTSLISIVALLTPHATYTNLLKAIDQESKALEKGRLLYAAYTDAHKAFLKASSSDVETIYTQPAINKAAIDIFKASFNLLDNPQFLTLEKSPVTKTLAGSAEWLSLHYKESSLFSKIAPHTDKIHAIAQHFEKNIHNHADSSTQRKKEYLKMMRDIEYHMKEINRISARHIN